MITPASQAAEDHLRAHRALIGSEDDPRYGFVRSAERRTATTAVAFEQTYDGLPVWGTSIAVHLTRHPLRVLAARSDARGGISLHRPSEARVQRHLELDAVRLVGPRRFAGPTTPHLPQAVRVLTRRLVFFRHESADGVDRAVVRGQDRVALECALEVVTGDDIAVWTTVTDVDSGAVLHVGPLVIDLDTGGRLQPHVRHSLGMPRLLAVST